MLSKYRIVFDQHHANVKRYTFFFCILIRCNVNFILSWILLYYMKKKNICVFALFFSLWDWRLHQRGRHSVIVRHCSKHFEVYKNKFDDLTIERFSLLALLLSFLWFFCFVFFCFCSKIQLTKIGSRFHRGFKSWHN